MATLGDTRTALPSRLPALRGALGALALLLCALGLLAGWHQWLDHGAWTAREALEREADRIAARLDQQLDDQRALLISLAAVMETEGSAGLGTMAGVLQRLGQRLPALRALAYVPVAAGTLGAAQPLRVAGDNGLAPILRWLDDPVRRATLSTSPPDAVPRLLVQGPGPERLIAHPVRPDPQAAPAGWLLLAFDPAAVLADARRAGLHPGSGLAVTDNSAGPGSWPGSDPVAASGGTVHRGVGTSGGDLVLHLAGGPGPALSTRTADLAMLLLPGTTGLLLLCVLWMANQHALASARQQVAQLHGLEDSSPLALLRWGGNPARLILNARAASLLGLPREASAADALQRIDPLDRAQVESAVRSAAGTGEPIDLVCRLAGGTAGTTWVQLRAAPVRTGSRLQGYAGIVEDISARHAQEELAEQGRAFLGRVLDAVPYPVFVTDRQHVTLYANQAFATYAGTSQAQLIGRPSAHYRSPDLAAQFYAEDDTVFATGLPYVGEQFLPIGEREPLWLHKTKTSVVLADGSPGLVVVLQEITARKQAEQALRQSQEFLQRVVDAIPLPLFVKDTAHRFVVINQAYATELLDGRDRSTLLGTDCHDFLPPAQRDRFLAEDDEVVATGTPLVRDEVFLPLSGGERHLRRHKVRVTLSDGSCYVAGAFFDFTTQHEAVAQAEASRHFLQSVLDAIPLPVFVKDRGHHWVLQNRAHLVDVMGNRVETTGLRDEDVLAPELAARNYAQDDAVFATGEALVVEEQLASLGGAERVVLKSKAGFRLPDGTPYVVGVMMDITEQRRASEAVEQARQFLQSLLDAIPLPVFVKDQAHRWVLLNRACATEITGTDFSGKGVRDEDVFAPEVARRNYREDEEALASGEPLYVEQPLQSLVGVERFVLKSKASFRLPDGTPYVVGVMVDITERRRATQAAEQARQFLQSVLDAIPLPVFVKDHEHRWVLENRACVTDIMGGRQDTAGLRDADLFPPELAERNYRQDDAVIASGETLVTEERLTSLTPSDRFVLKNKTAFRLPDGTPYVVGILLDITERRRAAEEAQNARQFLQSVLDGIPLPIFVKDRAHRWVLLNRAYHAEVLGDHPTVVGLRDEDLFTPELAERAYRQDDEAFASSQPMLVEERMASIIGTERFVLKSKASFRLPDGTPYVVGIMMDITERRRATVEAQNARQFLQRLVDALPSPLAVKDAHGHYILANARARSAFFPQADADAPERWRDADVFSGERALRLADEDRTVLEGRGTLQVETTFRGRDGVVRHWFKSKACFALDDGTPYIVSLLADVSALKEAQAALRISESRLQAENRIAEAMARDAGLEVVIRTAVHSLAACFPRHRVSFALAGDAQRLSVTDSTATPELPALAAGTPGPDPVEACQGLADSLPSAWAASALGDGPVRARLSVAVRVEQRALGLLWLDAAQPEPWAGHEVRTLAEVADYLAVAFRQAHAQQVRQAAEQALRESEAALRRSEARFRSLAELSSDWFWEQGPDFRFTTSGPARGQSAHRGFSHDYIGYTRWELVDGAPEGAADWSQHIAQLQRHEPFHGLVYRRRTPGGTEQVILSSGQPLFDESGAFLGYHGVASDVTERVRAQQELQRHRDHLQQLVDEQTGALRAAKEAAEQANRAKSEFLANMSHELRTPMHAILSFARMGVDRAATGNLPADKSASYFSRIDESARRLLALLNDLLDLAKLEAGGMRYEFGYHDLGEVAATAVTELEGVLRQRALHCEMLRPPTPVRARCDPFRIGQVLRNLLSNAAKFSPDGGLITLQVAQEGGRALVQVLDRGVGVPESELEAIFDKFVQSSKTKSGAGGTGLGLAICREILTQHGGSVEARNRPGGGAAFAFTLPLARPGDSA